MILALSSGLAGRLRALRAVLVTSETQRLETKHLCEQLFFYCDKALWMIYAHIKSWESEDVAN